MPLRRTSVCASAAFCVALLAGAGATLAPTHLACAAEASQPLIGLPAGDVLDNLRPQELTFIYNTRLVPPRMPVESEPSARSGLALAEEILAAHGLGILRVTRGVFAVVPGVRIDTQTYDGSGDDEQIALRPNVLFALNDATRIRATWGRLHQSHAINELQVEDGIDRFHGAQHADHLIPSLDRALREGVDLRIEAYRKEYKEINPRFENLFNPLVLLPETEFDRVMIAPGGTQAAGVSMRFSGN